MTGEIILEYERIADEMGDATYSMAPIGSVSILRQVARHFIPDIAGDIELEAALETVSEITRDNVKKAVERGWTRCESPIEKMLLPWLLVQEYSQFYNWRQVLFPGEGAKLGDKCIAIVPQLPIGKYRADFAIAGKRGKWRKFVIVECDGAEHHGGVDNVERDVGRDVVLMAHNDILDVVRVTGSEIVRSAKTCAEQIAKHFPECWYVSNTALSHKFREPRHV